MRRLVIVTGLSGAGKSQAMKSFEDFGFACLDNAPPVLAREFVALAGEAGTASVAVAPDVREVGQRPREHVVPLHLDLRPCFVEHRRGPQPLAEIIPLVRVRLAGRVVQSTPSESAGP